MHTSFLINSLQNLSFRTKVFSGLLSIFFVEEIQKIVTRTLSFNNLSPEHLALTIYYQNLALTIF